MHMLSAMPGGYVDESGAIITRLDQTPGDIVILSSADTTLALLAAAHPQARDPQAPYPEVRLANLVHLRQHASIDLYIDEVLQHAKVIVVDHLGGESYWPYGTEQLVSLCRRKGIVLAMFSGDMSEDPNLTALSTADGEACHQLWRYLREGGAGNAAALYRYLGVRYFDLPGPVPPPVTLAPITIHHPQRQPAAVADWQARWLPGAPCVAVLFYRSHLQAGNTRVFDGLCDELLNAGLNPLPIALLSLKDGLCLATLRQLCTEHEVGLILNSTAFAHSAIDDPGDHALVGDIPVLQVMLSSGNQEGWQDDPHGLQPRDMAMQVALPEVDGRIISRAFSFKGLGRRCELTQCDVVEYHGRAERMAFIAELSRRWCRLRTLPNAEKRLALILANYPTREGRLGNGVGLDTPASIINILNRLQQDGYRVEGTPADGETLMAALKAGITNDPDNWGMRPAMQSLAMADYLSFFEGLPETSRASVVERWGPPEQDPLLRQNRFMIAGLRLGTVFVGIQPARGYNLDEMANYHDPDLVPPHHYLAFYAWLRRHWACDAIVHVGKHGNLEWLPGKSVALSDTCWPDIIFGPMPHLYPFIVNDPGEGTQAKRRTQAVIIDHLMPPLTRAESYGPTRDLERLIDEFYDALTLDPRRAGLLRKQILAMILQNNLHADLGMPPPSSEEDEQTLLNRTDTYLCELKESQIRDGLHVFGESPQGRLERDTLLALARHGVGDGQGRNASLVRALVHDLLPGGEFDPLTGEWGNPWEGGRPEILCAICDGPWRTLGDTRERLELLALALLEELESNDDAAAPSISVGAGRAAIRLPAKAISTSLQDVQTDRNSRASPLLQKPAVDANLQQPTPPVGASLLANCDIPGDALVRSEPLSRATSLLQDQADLPQTLPHTHPVLQRITDDLRPRLRACGPQELHQLSRGLEGRFVPPGPSGAPTRGRPDVLPTGRNFFSVDTRMIPTPTAWTLGEKSAALLVERYVQDNGDYPSSIGLSVWGTATMRTGGDDVAQAFALIGVRPKWAEGSHRVTDFEIIPVPNLGRPRVDVTLRVSGFFRDAFSGVMQMFDAAVQTIAGLDEPEEANPIRARILRESAQLQTEGLDETAAHRRASFRIFGAKPGAYGAGLQGLMDSRDWRDEGDLARAYLNWGGFAYGAKVYGEARADTFAQQLTTIQAVVQNQDNREHDLLDSDDYYQFQGGMSAAVHHLSGDRPALLFGDHSNPEAPRIRGLDEEISRVVRARATNPKWIEGMRRHGYKGAFEMAATVELMFAFDATTGVVRDDQYAGVTDAYLEDPINRDFLQRHNPDALHDIAERLLEAVQRGLWAEPGDYRERLEAHLLNAERDLET
ncbi:cobaltochelatase subunit CobN [Pseudomonas matsuisoli]|uniref:Cobaltochelatase subunit CobN n=1 Tax=Pseudomonas matsuisoli TaxID=1515666 RepID=A0A917Q2G3_9PSED|nr:cobaltochelatase subunit CobN [Pseudomonas matsuisoli]GGK07306.1 cobaltochelatase subunit CobN [Pseudomonas matsuisoli]